MKDRSRFNRANGLFGSVFRKVLPAKLGPGGGRRCLARDSTEISMRQICGDIFSSRLAA